MTIEQGSKAHSRPQILLTLATINWT